MPQLPTPVRVLFCGLFVLLNFSALPAAAGPGDANVPPATGNPPAIDASAIRAERTLRLLSPDMLELEIVATKPAEPGTLPWFLATPLVPPAAGGFTVSVEGRAVTVRKLGVKRRALYAPLRHRELRVGTWVSLQLAAPVADGASVEVREVAAGNDEPGIVTRVRLDPARTTPVIHVNQEGYDPDWPKLAMVGSYLGSAGELAVSAQDFEILDQSNQVVFRGPLRRRADVGYTYQPAPYQEVFAADFSSLQRPGVYRVRVAGLGVSLPFRIDAGSGMNVARAYALGVYHQRCGTTNALPFTRFTHEECHVAPAHVPVPAADFAFTWTAIARAVAEAPPDSHRTAPPLTTEAAQLYPFVHRGTVDVAGGHHDAGDYSKYTINSAALVHCLIFAVDSLPGVAELDNLGLPESGDGIPDVLQEAHWETEFLARLQDDDGGFYFLVYPRDRPYENNVLPDHGDPQVVWPKNTAATAAAVAALAQASSSPRFRRAYPDAARDYLARARRGWEFLERALAQHGRDGSYQRLTHYGDFFGHDDELAWAACEMFLATGGDQYAARWREWCDPASETTRRWGWWRLRESWGNAIRSYAFAARSGRLPAKRLDPDRLAACEREIEAAARDTLRWSDQSAYGTSFPEATKRMRGGGWYFSLDQAFDLAVASALDFPPRNDPRPDFLRASVANLDYELGLNPVNQSYVTGLGCSERREMVHQFAQNDWRILPPSGLPLGNLQSGQPYLDSYRGELGAVSYPEDGAARAPYAYYDRWTDTYDVSAEFVVVNQARALATAAWLAAREPAARQPWRPVVGTITGLPATAREGNWLEARFVAPPSMAGAPVDILWETRGAEPMHGSTFRFACVRRGDQPVEAEARWADGRRVFARAVVRVENDLPDVSVTADRPTASAAEGTTARLRFHRTGSTAAPLTVRFDLRGTATKWNDYRRPEGDMPVEMTIPAGQADVTMELRAMAAGLGNTARLLVLVLKPDPAYNVVAPHAAIVALLGTGRPEVPAAPAVPPLPQ